MVIMKTWWLTSGFGDQFHEELFLRDWKSEFGVGFPHNVIWGWKSDVDWCGDSCLKHTGFSPVGCLSWSCSIHLDWGSWDTTSSNLTTAGFKLRPSKRSCPCKTSGLSESCVSENPKESYCVPRWNKLLVFKISRFWCPSCCWFHIQSSN